MDLTQKILGYLKLEYDVVEYMKKIKYNITFFELCKITQLREKLHEDLKHIQGPQDVMFGNTKVTLKGKNVKVNKLTKSSSVTNTSNVENKSKIKIYQNKGDPRADEP